jgi:4-aminobutyrate aminotransferase
MTSSTEATPVRAEPPTPSKHRGVSLVTPIPGPKGRAIIERDHRALMTSTKTGPIVAASGEGMWVTDVDGNRLLDFAAGVGVQAVGYAHPEVVRAVREQAGRLTHFAGADFYYENQVTLAERIARIVPGAHAKKVFFTNSGTESMEAALKLLRWHRQRPIVIGLLGGFHGRTMGALSLTASKPVQRARYDAFVGGGHHIPPPYCYRCPYQLEYPSCDLYCAKVLKELYFQTSIPPEDVAAFAAEPVMGEGGYVVPPPKWLSTLKGILDAEKIPLIDDEVQSGIGRTGRWFAIEHHQVVPEVVTMAKALGGGLPMGAIAFPAELDFPHPGPHANTFGGNLLAAAASLATLEIIEKERLLDRARTEGEYLIGRLRELQSRHPEIGDVRGLGLMTATEFVKDRSTKEPAAAFRDRVLDEAYRRGLILLPCGRSTIRYIPPLIVHHDEIDEAIEIVDASIRAARALA